MLFWKNTLRTFELDVLIEADAGNELLYKVYVLTSLEVIVEFDYIWVVTLQLLHACDLSLNGLPLCGIVELILRVDLNGNFLLGLFVLGELHIRVGTRPQMSNYDEIV